MTHPFQSRKWLAATFLAACFVTQPTLSNALEIDADSELTVSSNHELVRVDRHRIFVKLKKGKRFPRSEHVISATRLFGRLFVVQTTDADALRQELTAQGLTEYTERNTYHGKQSLPEPVEHQSVENTTDVATFNDPMVGKIWSFADDSGNGISVNKAYTLAATSSKKEVIVAVVDTGVDYNHEDLKEIMWVNKGEVPGNGIDDDRNGYVDDVYGIDTLTRDAQGRATGDPMASHAHGTHVSGTIAAKQNNRIGIAGIASNVKIMAIRTVPDDADETDVNIVESFLYAAKNGARLINCSFGKTHNEGGMAVKETIDHIFKNFGTLVVAAAGNDSSFGGKWDIDLKPKYPASFNSDGLMVIASTAQNGGLSYFSNVGKRSVDLAAPGSDIYSTVPGNRYAGMSGTSMATPTAVGMMAEVLSQYPNLTGAELKQLAIDSVTKVSAFSSYMVSGGRGNMYNMLKNASQMSSRYR
jgi:subtilisin family serine protease